MRCLRRPDKRRRTRHPFLRSAHPGIIAPSSSSRVVSCPHPCYPPAYARLYHQSGQSTAAPSPPVRCARSGFSRCARGSACRRRRSHRRTRDYRASALRRRARIPSVPGENVSAARSARSARPGYRIRADHRRRRAEGCATSGAPCAGKVSARCCAAHRGVPFRLVNPLPED